MKAALFRELYEIMHNNEDFFILGQLKQTPNFEKIARDFQPRFIDISTCEQSALSMAVALASKGTCVILCIPIPHFILRWYEDLLATIGHRKLPIIIVGITSQKSPDKRLNITFRSELILAYTIPSLTIITPATRREIGTLLVQACQLKHPAYIHFERDVEAEITTNKTLAYLFEPIEYDHGTQAICIGIGSALNKAHQAKMLLENYGYSTSLVSMHTVKPLNHAFLYKTLHSYSAIFTFEDQDSSIGIGSLIGCFIAENRTRPVIFKSFGTMATSQEKRPAHSDASFDMRASGLEILDLLATHHIIPDHESWTNKK